MKTNHHITTSLITKLHPPCMLAIIAAACASFSSVAASNITLAPGGNPAVIDRTGFGQSYTLDPSLTDWLLAGGNKKLGGSITSNGPNLATFLDYPNFTYSDGTSPAFASDENSSYRYLGSGSFTITIPLTPGSGQVTLWLGCTTGNHTSSFTADFPDTAGTDFSTLYGNTISEEWFLNYTSSVAQAMTVTITTGAGSDNSGFFAVAVGAVPEPATAGLLGSTMIIALLFRRVRRSPHKSV